MAVTPLEAAGGEERAAAAARPLWPDGWWALMERRIGVIPIPVYVVLVALIAVFVITAKVRAEISVVIAVMAVFGFTLAEFGKRLPLVRHIGAAAIFATFIPSYLAFHQLIPKDLLHIVSDFTKTTNFLYLYITFIIVGSILGMDRRILIRGFLKIFIPLAAGSLVAGAVGTLTAVAVGLEPRRAFFFIVVPIMAGGVGEGAIPLSLGYSEILHQRQGDIFAEVLPPVMLGSLTAILLSGTLNFIGKRYPHLTGEGRLQPNEHDDMQPAQEEITGHMDVSHIAAAGMTAIALYLAGILCHQLFGLPGPVSMLFLAVLMKLTHAVSPKIQEGAYVVYKFFSTAVTYPLLFAIGISMTPWNKLVDAFNLAYAATIFATVASLMATGFIVGRWLAMYPIEAAIINGCHSGQGGTGDVAILTAANRMQLMPFAQVATRIGGAITVTLTLIALSRLA
jgi:CCS family citrate carrier protein